MTHIILLLLIAREDSYLLDVGVEEASKHGITEGACAACDE
jgi:hypothetical protein